MTPVFIVALLAIVVVAYLLVRRASGGGSAAENSVNALAETASEASPAEALQSAGPAPAATMDPDSPINDPLRRGVRLFMREQYAEALPLLEPCAQQGSLKAQQLLAKMYYGGNGVPQDMDKYFYWLEQAAANGDRPSRIKVKKMKAEAARAKTTAG